MTNTDRIEKKSIVRAPRSRVFSAISDASKFGTWFHAKLDGTFAQGQTVRGRVTYPGFEHLVFDMVIERIEPEKYFAYRWHPCPNDPTEDYSKEPMTLVEFFLEETKEGTLLTVVESGFDKLPASRRDHAFRMNDEGWTAQVQNLVAYVAAS